LANAGTFNLTGSAIFNLGYNPYLGSAGNGTIENNSGGTFDFQTAATVNNIAGTNAFVNAGTLEQTVTTGTTDIGVAVDNTGTVSVKTGTLEFDGGGTSTAGKFTAASGATLDFDGGTFTLSGGSYDATGTTEVSGGTANFSGAAITSLGALDITGGTLSIANSGTAASFEQTGGTIGGAGTLTVSGAATFGGSGSGDQAEGTGTLLLDGTTTDTGTINLDGGYVLANAGTFNLTGSAIFNLGYNPYLGSAGNGTIQNNSGGTFDFQTASTVEEVSGTTAFINAGTLEQTVTTGTTDIGVTVTNTGTVSVQTGTLEFSGGGTSTAGKFTVASGATLEFGGGTFTLSGGSYDATGTTEVSGGTANFSGATITSLGALDITGGTLSIANSGTAASFEQTGGTIGRAGTLTVSGAATFGGSGSGDQAEGTGTLLLDGTTTDTGTINLDGGYVLANAGTFDVTSGGAFYLGYNPYIGSAGSGTIQNNSGGTFDFQTASTVEEVSGTTAFINAGTLEQTVTTGTTDIGVTFTNTGTVSVKTGTLEFSVRGSSSNGIYTLASGATLDFDAGTFTLSGDSFSGAGVAQLSGGTLVVSANSTIGSGFTQTGGTLTGPATLTVTGAATFAGSGNGDQAEGAGTLLLDGTTTDSGEINLDGGYVLANAGTFDVTGSATFDLGYNPYIGSAGNGTIENNSGGTFDFQTASAVNNVAGANAFVNAGTLEQTVTTGTTDIGVTLTNTGTVSVKTGTLEFSAGGTSTAGKFTVASGATLDFDAGAFTLSGGSISGAGTLLLAGGSTTLKSRATVSVADFSETGSGTSLTVGEALAYAETFSQGAGTTTAISKGDSLSLTGTASLSGTTSGAGTLDLAGGSATIDKGAKLSVSHWSISGAGTDVTLDASLTYAKSFSEGAGDTLVLSGGHLLLSGADTFAGGTVDGSKLLETKGTTTVSGLTIGGTVEWENTTTVTQSGTVTIGDLSGHKAFLDNTSTGIYDVTANSAINQGSSTASYIENAGLFEETGGTSTSTIAPAVTNTGTIEVTAATLDFKGAVTGTGTDTISGASTLEFDSGMSSSTTVGSQNIGFTGGGTLDLTDPNAFFGEISNFATTDTVELLGSWAFSAFSENSGGTLATLTLVNGSTTHAFDFVGDFTQSDFKITSGATSTITHT
jgi:hypothetical protein